MERAGEFFHQPVTVGMEQLRDDGERVVRFEILRKSTSSAPIQ
jgi:hypothetical protein